MRLEGAQQESGSIDLEHVFGGPATAPDASVVVPVNAQGDLENILNLLGDISLYEGPYHFEIILVVNNFPEAEVPEEAEKLRQLGVRVLTIPNVRKPGEAVGFTARIPGIREARTETVILFDSDCRIPNATALLNWYVVEFGKGCGAAYTHVDYWGLADHFSIKLRMWTHHGSRWVKRNVLGIPTTRGSNYTVKRSVILEFYDTGLLADEMNVGPTFKARGHAVVYSGNPELTVLTSGRMFSGDWKGLIPYLIYRLKYNLRVLPGGKDVARRTGREKDPVRRYIDNKPV